MKVVFQKQSIVHKLGDLGEARSAFVQICMITRNAHTRLNTNGSAAFMASEILIHEELLEFEEIDEMKKIDIWTLFMTLFLVINPNQTHSFELNINDSAGKEFVTSAAQQ